MSNNHDEVTHNWAHQTGRKTRGFNMFYEGATIYSYGYHFPIARLVEKDGATIVLFTARDYSVSTAKHKTIVRRAVQHLPMVEVTDISPHADPVKNHDRLIESAFRSVATAKRARKYGDSHLSDARRYLDQANRYAALVGLDRAPVSLESIGVAVAELEARLAAARAAEVERQRRAQIARAEHEKAEREAWLNGQPNRWRGTDANGSALLRLRPRPGGEVYGERVQTSLGAEIPLQHAIRAFRFVKLVRERGADWRRNGQQVLAGDYQIDAIDAQGNLRAGCHKIHWPEIARFARVLEIFDDPASDEAVRISTAA